VSDDSLEAVGARWSATLARDSSDRAAALGLGTLAQLTYDFPAATSLFHRLLADTPTPDAWTVQARLGLYRVALGQGDYRRADSLLSAASADARRLGDREGEMDALIGFSLIRSATSGLEAALAALDSLAPILPTGASRERAYYLCRRGHVVGAMADAEGPRLAAQGLAMAARLGERRLTGYCLEARAMAHSFLGHTDSVLPFLDRADSLFRATRDHAARARLASRRSDELQFRGRLGEAKSALQEVLTEAEISRNRERFAFAYSGLGALAVRLNDLPTAVEYFERTSALYDSLGQEAGARIARGNRAWILSMGEDLERARTALQTMLDDVHASELLEDEVFARQLLARVAIRREEWGEATAQLDTAERVARAHGRGDGRHALAFDRGRLALGMGDLTGAERELTRFLGGIEPENHLHRYLTRNRLAEVWARRGDVARAEREIAAAGREIETWRAGLDDDELRRFAFAATALGEQDPQAPVSRVLAALAAGGRTETAFAIAEQRRARALSDRLNQTDALNEEGWRAGTKAHRVHPVTASEVAAALPDESTALVEYLAGTGGSPTTMFVVTRSGARAHLLPTADSLAPPIRRLVAMLEGGGDPAALARTLGETLLTPLAESLPAGITRLVIVPDGPIHRLAFDVLRMPDGRPMVDRWAVGLTPSAGVALGLWQERGQSPGGQNGELLALGDPEFPGEPVAVATRGAETYRSAFAVEGGLARLTGSGEEVRQVARYAPGEAEVRLRGDASEQWLKRTDLRRFRVIHLATHALVDESSLARTVLALAPGEGEDGFLSPADLGALHLDADLVVLSACRTAGGVAITGEGMEGLTAPLVSAGARSVVATQWRIGDQSTVRLVEDFYAGLAGGMPVVDALRSAKLRAKSRGAPPSDWAGFTVVGDPLARADLTAPVETPGHRWLAIAAAVVMVAMALLLVRRRRAA
jgi:CHAT domain-containing protein/tetratricopeptide (TPR) repeat protein